MKKTEINFIINVFMFLCMSAVAGIGFLIKYTLITGKERWIEYNDNVQLCFWGMDRHEWGTIHLIIGYVLLGLLILHIVLHWSMIISVYRKMFGQKRLAKFISVGLVAICALFIVVPFFINPEIAKAEQGARRHVTNRKTDAINKGNTVCEKEAVNTADFLDEHEQLSLIIDIRGYMTLDEISEKYKVPAEIIKIRLNIPKSVSGKQKLGWLKKRYPIKMHDVEAIIKEYQEVK